MIFLQHLRQEKAEERTVLNNLPLDNLMPSIFRVACVLRRASLFTFSQCELVLFPIVCAYLFLSNCEMVVSCSAK